MRRPNTKSVDSADRSAAALLERTTDLMPIQGRKVLVLLDEQNLSIGARQLGYRLRYGLLAKRIRSAAGSAEMHLFTASGHSNRRSAQHFFALGYIVHTKTVRRIRLPDGSCGWDSNIDNLCAFWAGIHAVKAVCDVIVLASGDYGLAGELAQAIRAYRGRQSVQIMTLSLPGSTAQDLDAHSNPHIAANLEIGLDVLTPFSASLLRKSAARAVSGSAFGHSCSSNFYQTEVGHVPQTH